MSYEFFVSILNACFNGLLLCIKLLYAWKLNSGLIINIYDLLLTVFIWVSSIIELSLFVQFKILDKNIKVHFRWTSQHFQLNYYFIYFLYLCTQLFPPWAKRFGAKRYKSARPNMHATLLMRPLPVTWQHPHHFRYLLHPPPGMQPRGKMVKTVEKTAAPPNLQNYILPPPPPLTPHPPKPTSGLRACSPTQNNSRFADTCYYQWINY